jgi:hypothetical protein
MSKLIIQDLPYLDDVAGSDPTGIALQGGLYVRAGGSASSGFGSGTWVTTWAIARGPVTSTYTDTLAVATLPASGSGFSYGMGVAGASASGFSQK